MSKIEDKEDNIVKKTCKELGITQKELAEELGVKEQSLRNMLSNGTITLQIEKSINLLILNSKLKSELESYHVLKKALKSLSE